MITIDDVRDAFTLHMGDGYSIRHDDEDGGISFIALNKTSGIHVVAKNIDRSVDIDDEFKGLKIRLDDFINDDLCFSVLNDIAIINPYHPRWDDLA